MAALAVGATRTYGPVQAARASADEKNADKLTPEQREELRKLQSRDLQVRAHEQAHSAVGGAFAGAPSYTLVRGPDGTLYAVGGEVDIDASPVPDDPAATIAKLRTVQAAALAPADPSPQDRRVAARAAQGIVGASLELAAQEREEKKENPAIRAYRSAAGDEGERPGGLIEAVA
ncbi:MAG: hypothetical protein HYV18_07800 [Gammaproteobacteria bacterium]|nr:hypothetical protein [Gammaproteobacteria bacterium]